MRLLIDECVADPVADAFGDRGYEIHYARDECPEATDQGVQHHADQIDAIVVTWNIKDFRGLLRPRRGRVDNQSHLGRLDFKCKEALGPERVVELGDLIDAAYAIHRRARTDRFIVRITSKYVSFYR